MPKADTLLSPLQVAQILGVGTRTVARWADDPNVNLTVAEFTEGGQRRFNAADVERFAAERSAV